MGQAASTGMWGTEAACGCLGVSGVSAKAPGVSEPCPGSAGPELPPSTCLPCRGKLAWKALLGRLAPLAPRAPLGSPGRMACEGSRAPW